MSSNGPKLAIVLALGVAALAGVALWQGSKLGGRTSNNRATGRSPPA